MEEVDTTEDSRQMLVFTHSLNLSVAEEAISNSFPKISSTPKVLPAQNPPPLSFFQSKVTPPSYSSHPGNCRPSPQLLPEQSSIRAPPLHSSAAKAPDDVPSGRKLARSSSEAGKKAQPNHQLGTIPTRTPVAKTPQLTRPQVSSPSRTCPIAASPSKTRPRAPKLIPIPIAPQTTPHGTDTPHPSQCPTRRRRPSPRRRRRRARSPGPSASLFSTRRSVLHPRADPSRETPLRATVDR